MTACGHTASVVYEYFEGALFNGFWSRNCASCGCYLAGNLPYKRNSEEAP